MTATPDLMPSVLFADWPPPNHQPERDGPTPGECRRCGADCEPTARVCRDCFTPRPTFGLPSAIADLVKPVRLDGWSHG